MGFAAVDDGAFTITPAGTDLHVAWSSALPAGTWWQAYVDGVLAWSGTTRRCVLPRPSGLTRIDVGSVADISERYTDFGGSLPAAPSQRARLTWQGGAYLGSLAGFRVRHLDPFAQAPFGVGGFGSTTLATVPAYPGGVVLDGFGVGGFGSGGFGSAALDYAWTSDRLSRGDHAFAVTPFDPAGNEQGSPTTTTVTITAPPRPPSGLALAYDQPTGKATLTWTRSPL